MNVLTPTRPETALAKADVGTIVFLPGTYWRDRSLGVITKNVNLVARGPGVVLTGWQNPATVSWSPYGGQIWKAARSTVQLVADAKPGVRTAWGDYPVYVQQPTLAKVTGPGQWFTDGTTVYVWPIDGRSLSNDVDFRLSIRIAGTGISVQGGATVYVQGIDVEGAGSYLSDSGGIAASATATGSPTLSLVNCRARYCPRNGISTIGGTVISSVRCSASSNGNDGFNYHASITNPYVPRFIENGCGAYRNGQGQPGMPETQNGSAAHDKIIGQRIDGNYHDNFGPNVADSLGARTWNFGCTFRASTGKVKGIGLSTSGVETVSWLSGCVVQDNGIGLQADTSGVMQIRGTTYGGNGQNTSQISGGAIADY
jgi:hypothetical protein